MRRYTSIDNTTHSLFATYKSSLALRQPAVSLQWDAKRISSNFYYTALSQGNYSKALVGCRDLPPPPHQHSLQEAISLIHRFRNNRLDYPNMAKTRAATRKQKQQETQDAILKVFHTPELCENVLVYLSCDDLARARRVSRHFTATVDASPLLQQNLYMSPRLDHTAHATPTIASVLTGIKVDEHLSTRIFPDNKLLKEMTIHELHPALEVHRQSFPIPKQLMQGYVVHTKGRWRSHIPRKLSAENLSSVPMMTIKNRRCLSTIPIVSALHNMYICQPPVATAQIIITNAQDTTTLWDLLVQSDQGITFGILHDAAKRYMLATGFSGAWCVKHIYFREGLPMTAEERLTLGLEDVDELAWWG